jgi:hypothetical protein
MELTFAHQRDRFACFALITRWSTVPSRCSVRKNERPFAEAETTLFFEVDPTARKAVLTTLFSK